MKLFIHHPVFRLIIPFAVGGLAYLFTLMAFGRISELQDSFEISEWLLCLGLSYLLFEGLRFLSILANRYLSAKKNIYVKFWIQLAISLFFSLFFIGLGISAYFIFYLEFRNFSSFHIEMWTINFIFAFITVAYTTAINSITVLKTQNEQALNEAQIRQQHLNLSLIRYNQEIQPELLYNGLETIIPFLYQDQTIADELIQKLSEIYRYQLEKRKEELVKLSDELKIVQAWLYIWDKKYPAQIKWSNRLEREHFSSLVLPGSLTNCITYLMEKTLFSQLQPIQIQMHIQNDRLWISSNRNDRLAPAHTESHTLDSLQQCYVPFTEKKIKKETTSTAHSIGLPLLTFIPKYQLTNT